MGQHTIQLLDCTLRDGCYIVNAEFGVNVIRGIAHKLYAANIDVIECGWLKDKPYQVGTAFYHVPADALPYLPDGPRTDVSFVAMIDWDRYNLDALPPYCGKGISAIRLVFPKGKVKEALALAPKITGKGYRLFLQAANTLGYSDKELLELVDEVNKVVPYSLSIVDTFGAMYPNDLDRIFSILANNLDPSIRLGFHSHNNQQLSFALSMEFLKLSSLGDRDVIVDSSLYGMGRGAGNTNTELLAHYLNRFYAGNYDMNEIMDTIDLYMTHLRENHTWGYSIPYCIAGIYCCHVNNIAYLLQTHKTMSKDMRIIIESLSPEMRKKYDYDNLERVYMNYQNKIVSDESVMDSLFKAFQGRHVLLAAPGRNLVSELGKVQKFVKDEQALIIGVNHVPEQLPCDYYFFSNASRYQFAMETASDRLLSRPVILTSNIVRNAERGEMIINFNQLAKLGWTYFDNASIMCLRLMAKLAVAEVGFAGLDGFPENEGEKTFYANALLQKALTLEIRHQINKDVASMLQDFVHCEKGRLPIRFVTTSVFHR